MIENTPSAPAILIEETQEARDRELSQAVTIILPAFNEGAHIAGQIQAVRSIMNGTDWVYEIVVVDDGSSDDTGRNAASEGIRVLRHNKNRGYGAALKRGIAAAQYDWIMIMDADGTYPSAALPLLLEHASGNEMVVGARTGAIAKAPFARRPAKWFLGRLASYLAGQHLPDLNSGLRLMRKELVDTYLHLLPSGFSFTTTITLSAACNDHDIKYVPIDYHARLGKSKIRPRHAYDFLLLILRTIVFFNPLKVFIPIGLILASLGLGKFIYDVTLGNISESALLGILGALIVWAVGLLADQNARIHGQNVRARRGW
jgi:glycosyltransferase involved in cell wall biosynthesis